MNIENQSPLNIAMWSGPRNLSTALMYSFAQRTDCQVMDEPFYATYLQQTGIQHAMYQQIIEQGEIDASKVAQACVQLNGREKPLCYQKQMTKHMLPSIDREWIHQVTNVFLIRDPLSVIASYHAKQEDPVLSDIGVQEQVEIFEMLSEKNAKPPIVVNSADILNAPEAMLSALCDKLELEFQSSMLCWPAGPKTYDGVWAPHWYKSVWQSTGFVPTKSKPAVIPPHLNELAEQAMSYYNKLNQYALKVN